MTSPIDRTPDATLPPHPVTGAFKTPWWLGNPHLQSLWGTLFRRRSSLRRRRERLELDDGDFIDLDWHCSHSPQAPILLALHGLTGSSQSHYILGIQSAMAHCGWNSVALNMRGCSGEPNRLPRGYHSGASDYYAEVVNHVRNSYPGAPLFACAYSLGANILLKYLGERGVDTPLQATAAVSVPFQLDRCADHIEKGFARVYQAYFVRELIRYVEAKKNRYRQNGQKDFLDTLERLGPLTGIKTLRTFDDRITAPLSGFIDSADYYHKASCRQFLGGIRIPTLILHARDDPFIDSICVPRPGELPPSCTLELSRQGGHVGFLTSGLQQPGLYYLEHRLPQWFLQQREQQTIRLDPSSARCNT